MILLFQGNPLHAASLHTFAIGDLWAMGSALSWALYCSLLRLKDAESRRMALSPSARCSAP